MEGKFVEQDIGKALEYYTESCDNGDSEAWYRLGRLLQYHNVKGESIQVLNKNIKENR